MSYIIQLDFSSLAHWQWPWTGWDNLCMCLKTSRDAIAIYASLLLQTFRTQGFDICCWYWNGPLRKKVTWNICLTGWMCNTGPRRFKEVHYCVLVQCSALFLHQMEFISSLGILGDVFCFGRYTIHLKFFINMFQ